MTRQQMLLIQLAEECGELIQMCSKSLRFGLDEVYEGQIFTNAERLMGEFDDVRTLVGMLREDGSLPSGVNGALEAKRQKVEKYLAYSKECGTLIEEVK